MTTAVVGGGPGVGEEPLSLTPKDALMTSTDPTALNGTTVTTTSDPVIQSPDSAIGSTPPTSTPDHEFTTATSTTSTTTDGGKSAVEEEKLKATSSHESPEVTSSDEEGYEEDDEGGVEEEELTPEEEEEGEEEVIVSAAMQFPLAKKAPQEVSPSSSPEPDGEERVGMLGGGLGVRVRVNRKLGTAAILKEASPSGCESDIEDNDEEEIEEDKRIEEAGMKDSNKDDKERIKEENSLSSATATEASTSPVIHLPDTVTRLDTPEGSAVYLVGTAHFSRESQEDVASTIRAVKPDVVVVELCKARTAILQLDEETILQESRSLDLKKVQMIVRQHGKIQGVLYLLLLSVSAHITKQLGMAPGGEFRTAFAEARRSAPGCLIQLGDRPIQITLSRALASLSLWHKIKLTWHILTSKEPISKEEVEKCKQRDFILEMLAEMTGQFPAISEVFVKERDVYLCRSLQVAAQPLPNPHSPTGQSPRVVVGVVGIGHVPGIVELWGKVTDADITPIMRIPPPTLSSRLLKLGFRAGVYGLVGFGLYRCLPRSAQSSIHSSIHSTLSAASALLPSNLWGK